MKSATVPPDKLTTLRFVPLGGLGEIGMNCFALEQQDGVMLVDCGTSFPVDDIGVDVLHPDFSWLEGVRDRLAGLFLTHGHEDHIGAVPYLLRRFRLPIWGPPHALELVKHRLAEHGVSPERVELLEAIPGRVHHVGPFGVEPIRVSHSIVEASALSIETCQGTLVHTGDFNFDENPPDGEPTDVARLQAIAERGVRLLLSDSTNIDVAERAGSERQVGARLHDLIRGAQGRVVVAMFASNVQRLILLGEIARSTGRYLCLLGRSLNVHVDIARRINRLNWPSNLLIAAEQLSAQRRDKVLVLAGGTQGEGTSAMRRLASGTHQHLRLEAGDSVIHSARVIPGNERSVHQLFCDLLRQGVHLHTRRTDPDIHTSGHAGRSEQARMIQLIKPQSFIPVHGTLHHLREHAALARTMGVQDTLVVENGTPVRVGPRSLIDEPEVPHGKRSIAYGGAELEAEQIRRRVELARSGVVCVALSVGLDGRCTQLPSVVARGIPRLDTEGPLLEQLAHEVQRSLAAGQRMMQAELEERVRRVVRRAVLELSGIRPVIVVQVIGSVSG